MAVSDPAACAKTAPERFTVEFDTTKGKFQINCTRAWSPAGCDRFYSMVTAGFFTDIKLFRAISGFMVQFGIHGDPAISSKWKMARIPDDPRVPSVSNTRGRLSFATSGPNSRTTQMFINFGDNSRLDGMGFTPFGEVAGSGMSVVDSFYTGYGEGAPSGRGPEQGRIQTEGNRYLSASFPNLDTITSVRLV